MKTKIIDELELTGKDCRIQPKDINWEAPSLGIFGCAPTAKAASILGKFASRNGGWLPFTVKEIREFAGNDFLFCGLSGGDTSAAEKLIVRGLDGKYRYTLEFIMRAYTASPKV